LDGDIDLAGLLDDDDRSGGLGMEVEGKKEKKGGEESHRERQQHRNQISSGKYKQCQDRMRGRGKAGGGRKRFIRV
jgi:hypothetical protein